MLIIQHLQPHIFSLCKFLAIVIIVSIGHINNDLFQDNKISIIAKCSVDESKI